MHEFERGGEEMEGTYVLIWSLIALALSLTGIKKTSKRKAHAGQVMGLIGLLWAWTIIIS